MSDATKYGGNGPDAVGQMGGSGRVVITDVKCGDALNVTGGGGGAAIGTAGYGGTFAGNRFMPASRRIAIIGYAPSVAATPWNDPDVAIWGLNDQLKTMPRVDVLFEIHAPDVVKAEGHWEDLKAYQGPILMQDAYPDIPNAMRYPLMEIGAKYRVPGTDVPYLTCSAAIMLAYALELNPAPLEIALYGVDLLMDAEFRAQRPSVEFWLGIAYARGIKVTLQQESGLLKAPYVYGYQDEQITAMRAQLIARKNWLESQVNQAVAEEQAARERRLQYAGALADHAYHQERLLL